MHQINFLEKTNIGIIGVTFAFFFLFTVFFAGTANAHKFIVTAWVEGDTVYVESGFGDGSPAKSAKVFVYDDNGKELLASHTNELGEYSFKVPKKTAMRVVVNAAMGHQSEVTIPVEDFEDVSPDNGEAAKEQAAESAPRKQAQPIMTTGLTAGDIQMAMERALDKKLRPVVKKLAKFQAQGPSIKDILGGIGYILGLVGIGAYFNYRRKKE